MNRFALLVFVWVVLALNVQAQEPTNKPVTIGVVFGFTGAAQAWSDYGRMGLELAQEEINNAGGIEGRPIELIYEDSKTNPANSVSAYRKLVTIDKVQFVIGNLWAFITNPLIPLAAKDRVILVSPTVMQEAAERTNDYFFTMGASVQSISAAVDTFFTHNKEIKSVGIFCWDDTWGQAHLKVWRERAIANGVTISAELCNVDFGNDFRTDVAKMAAKKVDAVIVAHMGDVILQRMQEQQFKPKVLATANILEEIKVKKSSPQLFEGIFITDWRPNDEFFAKFRKKFGRDPVLEAHNSYETLRSIAMSLKSNVKDHLQALRTVKYDGVAGLIDFSSSSFANKSTAQLYQVRNGNSELVH